MPVPSAVALQLLPPVVLLRCAVAMQLWWLTRAALKFISQQLGTQVQALALQTLLQTPQCLWHT